MDKKAIAEAFYMAMSEKNIEALAPHLHPDVHYVAPLADTKGKEAYLEAQTRFSGFFETLTIRASFGSEDQGMVVYDVACPPPVGMIHAATLMTFEQDLISRIELFYDARPFGKK